MSAPLKPGFFPWHNENCDLEFKYESQTRYGQAALPNRGYFCKTHNQWCHEYPVGITYTWDDATQTRVRRDS